MSQHSYQLTPVFRLVFRLHPPDIGFLTGNLGFPSGFPSAANSPYLTLGFPPKPHILEPESLVFRLDFRLDFRQAMFSA